MPSSAQPPSVDRADGGDLRYRVAHRVKRWKSGEAPELLRTKMEGELPLIIGILPLAIIYSGMISFNAAPNNGMHPTHTQLNVSST